MKDFDNCIECLEKGLGEIDAIDAFTKTCETLHHTLSEDLKNADDNTLTDKYKDRLRRLRELMMTQALFLQRIKRDRIRCGLEQGVMN